VIKDAAEEESDHEVWSPTQSDGVFSKKSCTHTTTLHLPCKAIVSFIFVLFFYFFKNTKLSKVCIHDQRFRFSV
jgi:hypothetical protein